MIPILITIIILTMIIIFIKMKLYSKSALFIYDLTDYTKGEFINFYGKELKVLKAKNRHSHSYIIVRELYPWEEQNA